MSKIVYGYEKPYTLEAIWSLISLTEDELKREMYERKFLGFIVLKDWKYLLENLKAIMNQPFFVQNAEQVLIKKAGKLLKIIRTFLRKL